MKEIQDIYSVVEQINKNINNQSLITEIQNLTRIRSNYQANQPNSVAQILSSIDNIILLVGRLNTLAWTSDHDYVSEKLDLSNLIGEKGSRYFQSIKQNFLSNPSDGTNLLQQVINDLNKLRTKPTQMLALLQPFELRSNIKLINEDEGIIEIIFDNTVAIDDFKAAKDQMSEWFLIIEGYARLLNVRREDFEIISITKNSPTKFKIKTTLKNTTLVLSIVTSLLLIEKTVLENRLMIEKLKQNNLISDENSQKKFIKDAEEHLDKKIKEELDKLVKHKIKEHNIIDGDGNGDIINNFTKGVENQYNFILNGGDVNFHVINGEISKQTDNLENKKEEIKQIKKIYNEQKVITSTIEPNDTTNK